MRKLHISTLIIAVLLLTIGMSAQAETLRADFTPCNAAELAADIATAGSNGQTDTITLDPNCTYTLTGDTFIQPDGGELLTINGNGATLDGDNAHQHFNTVAGSNVIINDVRFINGRDPNSGGDTQGGAIINHGTLTINRSYFEGNVATVGGGAISSQVNAPLFINDSTFVNNSTVQNHGGALFIVSNTTIANSTFIGNNANGNGGAIAFRVDAINTNRSRTLTVLNSTFYDNSTTLGDGAAIHARLQVDANSANQEGFLSVFLENSTIAANTSASDGGAFYLYNVFNNNGSTASGDLFFNMTNTVLSSNTADGVLSNCFFNSGGGDPVPTITSDGYNLVDDATCNLNLSTDMQNTPADLGPLADNGGFTQTMLPNISSPAIDAGGCADPSSDQRGLSRPVDIPEVSNVSNGCDIGAVEVQESEYLTCPDGTPGNDVLVCEIHPLEGGNNDNAVEGGTGEDNITINAEVENTTIINVFGQEDNDTITNNGSINILSGNNGSDSLTNSGTVTGSIFGEGGDDMVILQNGANGGADNNLPLDGGDGTDTLDFDFTGLDAATIQAILASDPANDSITINGETFTWVNFETLLVNGSSGGGDLTCDDGTPNADTLVCVTSPPIGSNTDSSVQAGLGADDVTINNGVTVESVLLENAADNMNPPTGVNGADDIAANNGTVTDAIIGDGIINGNGGNDAITNGGDANFIIGDGNSVNVANGATSGGDDSLTNNGTANVISGDGLGSSTASTLIAGDDTIINNGTATSLIGDDIQYDGTLGAFTIVPGGDYLQNSGTTDFIYGDYVLDTALDALDTDLGGADTIINDGTVNTGIFAEGGNDRVILRDGADGGDDNVLAMDGGAGVDELDFDLTTLTQTDIDAITAADPTGDLVTINGETFQWQNFEVLLVNGTVVSASGLPANLQPDGVTFDTAPAPAALTWAGVEGATWYNIYMQTTSGAPVLNEWFPADDLGCADNLDCVVADALPSWGLSNGDYLWWVGAYLPDNSTVWSGGVNYEAAAFTVNVPAPATPAGIIVEANNGRPTISFTDDPNGLWAQLYIGPNPTFGDYIEWHGRDVTNAPDYSCDAGTCRINPAFDANNSTYNVWMQVWGPGGLSQWVQGPDLILNLPAAALPVDPGVTDASADNPEFTWTAGANSTWYNLILAPTDFAWTWDIGWFSAAELDCAAPDDTCTYTSPALAGGVLPAGTYNVYVSAWGPGGASSGGVANSGYAEGTFIYMP